VKTEPEIHYRSKYYTSIDFQIFFCDKIVHVFVTLLSPNTSNSLGIHRKMFTWMESIFFDLIVFELKISNTNVSFINDFTVCDLHSSWFKRVMVSLGNISKSNQKEILSLYAHRWAHIPRLGNISRVGWMYIVRARGCMVVRNTLNVYTLQQWSHNFSPNTTKTNHAFSSLHIYGLLSFTFSNFAFKNLALNRYFYRE